MPVLQGAVAVDRKRDCAVHRSGGASGGIYRPLLPVAIDSVLHSFDVPAIAGREICAALALNSNAAGTATWSLRIARRQIGIAALAVGDVVVLNRCLVFESSGLARRRKRFLFIKFRDFCSVGFWLRWFRRFFLVKAFGGINGFAFGDHRFLGHGYAGGADQVHFGATQIATNAAPRLAVILNKGRNSDNDRQAAMHDDGVDEVLPEVLVWRIGDSGSHFYLLSTRAGGDGLGDD